MNAQQIERIRELRYMDGLSGPAVGAIVGYSPQHVRYLAPGRPGKIDNARLREAFRQSQRTATSVAWEIGWRCPDKRKTSGEKGDGSRLRRQLGLADDVDRDGRRRRRVIDAEHAALISTAIGVAPWSIGYGD
jgi:hypothetical protein